MRFSDSAIGTVLVLFGAWVFYFTRHFPRMPDGHPGPDLFPRVLAGLILLAGAVLIVRGIKRKERFFKLEVGGLKAAGMVNILFVLGAIVFYIFFSKLLGFQVTAFLIMFGMCKWLGVNWRWSLILGVGMTEVIYILFAKILLVPLPWGLWGW